MLWKILQTKIHSSSREGQPLIEGIQPASTRY
jgi:hypothetical protein